MFFINSESGTLDQPHWPWRT